MTHKYTFLISAVLLVVAASAYAIYQHRSTAPEIAEAVVNNTSFSPRQSPMVINVATSRVDEVLGVLQKLEQGPVADQPVPLVLHGDELRSFTRQTYSENRDLIELAGRLDNQMRVEVKACQTMMNRLGISKSDLPGYVEIVPFGPDEVLRLRDEGYEVYTVF